MRWLFASLFLSAVFQFAGCGPNSKLAEGVEKGPCYPNLTCNAGLTCLSGLCVYAGPSTATGIGVDTGVEIGTGGEGGGGTRSDAGIGGNTGTTGTGLGGAVPGGGNTAASGGTTNALAPDAGLDAFPDVASGCPADSICFKDGRAQGFFTGYGWADLGEKDSVSSPTCDTRKPITHAEACTSETLWNRTNALCMIGSIPPLPASPVQADYDSNWGVRIGVNTAEPPDAIGNKLSDYKTVTFTFSGSPKSGLRAEFHRKGDPHGTTYCVDSIKSGTAISLTKFNTKCWGEATTVLLSADDLPRIDKIAVRVSSGASKIDVDLCLEKVEFAK